MRRVTLIYGSSTGNTQAVAELLRVKLGETLGAVINVTDAGAEDFNEADILILGVSTWEGGGLQEDWAEFFPRMDALDLGGKKVALYCLGDGQTFSGLFANALRILHDKVVERGAEIIGHWPTRDYQFDHSTAVNGDVFVGLVVDEDNEADKTLDRVCQWADLIRPQFKD